jgi:hypothetical protein
MKYEEKIDRFIELRASGKSFKNISSELSIPYNDLLNLSKKYSYEINNLKAIELDYIANRYQISKSQRIEFIGSLISKLKNELNSRDLSDIPSEKLIDYLLKYSQLLGKEIEPTTFKQINSGFELSDFSSEVTWSS